MGASVAVNVAVNTSRAEVEDTAGMDNADNLSLTATSDHTLTTTSEAGAAGGVAVTPVAAITVGVNKTKARLGAGNGVNMSGDLTVQADHKSAVTTTAKGQTKAEKVAVGAALGVSIEIDNVVASVGRSVTSSGTDSSIDISAISKSSTKSNAYASAKGASENSDDNGGTVNEQSQNQANFGKDVGGSDVPETDTPPAEDKDGKQVTVAAAIGVGVIANEASASIEGGSVIDVEGDINIHSETNTNYTTLGTGEAVSDDVGIAAAVALTVANNKTNAKIGDNVTITRAQDINVTAESKQNMDDDFIPTLSSEAVAGASGGKVAVAGSLALVNNNNRTEASIGQGADVLQARDIRVQADDTSRIAAKAWAGALSADKEKSKAGVGASFAILHSNNKIRAFIGRDGDEKDDDKPTETTTINANSVTVSADSHRVDPSMFVLDGFQFDDLDPRKYIRTNNFYTEAIAGAASRGDAAVAGAFAVNVFENITEAYLDQKAEVTTGTWTGDSADDAPVGVEISSGSDTKAISFAGSIGATTGKAGVGVSSADIVNHDVVRAYIDQSASVDSQAQNADVKVAADAKQDLVAVSVSAGAADKAGVAGVLGVIVSANTVESYINDDAKVKSKRDVSVEASNDTNMINIAGGASGGKSAGVGGSNADNIVWNTTRAFIGQDAQVDAVGKTQIAATASEDAATAVISGASGGKAGVAGALSVNVIKSDTRAFIDEGAKINTIYTGDDQEVNIQAKDSTVIVGVSGAGAGGGKAGVGAALDTAVVAKTVKAYIADDTENDGNVAQVNAEKEIRISAASSESIVSVTAGFAGGGKAGVGGAVSIGVVKNDTQAYIGKQAQVESDGNVIVDGKDDVVAVLTAGSAAGGGDAGVGGSLGVATIIGSTKAYVNDNARVSAHGNKESAVVLSDDDAVKGLSVTARSSENVVTTVASGAGGGKAGVAATVATNVIASETEAYIGRGAVVNEDNSTAGEEQQVRVKAIDNTVLVGTAGSAGGGGQAGGER